MPSSNVSPKQKEQFYQRKDSRKYFMKNQLLTAKCETMDDMFSVSVQDVSPSGAFIYTKKESDPGAGNRHDDSAAEL